MVFLPENIQVPFGIGLLEQLPTSVEGVIG